MEARLVSIFLSFMCTSCAVAQNTGSQIDDAKICGEKAQRVLIKEASIQVTSKLLKGGVMCLQIGLDEKDFWYLAH